MWQRHVLEQLYPAAREFVEKYTREDASIIWRDEWPGMDGSDDGYESFYNFPLYYALGGQLANLNPSEPRRVILQAGMFAEHEFAGVRQVVHYPYQFDTIDARRFEVALVPGAVGRLEIDLRRYVHPPTYAFPWHDDPVFVSPEE